MSVVKLAQLNALHVIEVHKKVLEPYRVRFHHESPVSRFLSRNLICERSGYRAKAKSWDPPSC